MATMDGVDNTDTGTMTITDGEKSMDLCVAIPRTATGLTGGYIAKTMNWISAHRYVWLA